MDEPSTEAQTTNMTSPPTESAVKEADDVRRYLNAYKVARKFDEPARQRYARDRAYAAGDANLAAAVDANLLGSYIDILVAYIYAKDPDVAARPAERVGKNQLEDGQYFADTMQIIVGHLWRRGRLKAVMKQVVRSGYSTGPGWLKAAMRPRLTEGRDDVRKRQASVILAFAFTATGCSTVGVEPWERDVLAREEMQLTTDPVEAGIDDHIYFSKEASSGGRGFGGGGCGCN